MKECIIFLDSNRSGSSRDGIEAGKKLGYTTILFTNRKKFIRDRESFTDVDEMYFVNLLDKQEIKENIDSIMNKGNKIACIISFLDAYVYTAARFSNEYCQSSITLTPITLCLNKSTLREKLKDKDYTPEFNRISSPFSIKKLKRISFPLILKSPISNGSKDVYLIHDEKGLIRGIERMKRKKPSALLMEEYLDGPQYLIEVVIKDGKPTVVAVVKQEVTLDKRFIVTGYSVSSVHHDKALIQTIHQLMKDLHFKNGTCHVEMRLVNGVWKLIEINPRISGSAMNKMIYEAFGISLVEETLRIYLKKPLNITRKWERTVYTHYMTVKRVGKLLKVTGRNRAQKIEGIKEVFIKPKKGKILRPPTSMGHRYGYVMAIGDSLEEAEMRARKASKEIRFYMEFL
ncbi:ATP-grasp domain-containing protein [Rossellomorea aquimaris]|uniref:ATP-grasp domain-containing protein n=1 Tax=Rossellomorea aquimaris TaxID=189382 RepID=UPI0007D0AB7F|nr:ATP-grasp domain-containing protein [Rossellomorea aquimaris]